MKPRDNSGLDLNYSPDDEKGHYTLANVLLRQSKVNEATSHLERALQREPRNGDFHAEYGYAMELSGRKEEALAQYQKALQLSPRSALAHYNYAMFLSRAGKPAEATVEFEKALALKPDYADAHYDWGNLLYQKGDLEGAKTHYLACARTSPERVPAHNMLGIVLLRQGLTSQAILQFGEALELDPNDAYAAENMRRAQAIDASFIPRASPPR